MHLLERTALLRELGELLSSAAAGRGRVVALSGETGVGKSTVAQALAVLASDQLRVLWGACEGLSPPDPLGPLYDFSRKAEWRTLPETRGNRRSLFSAVLAELTSVPTLAVIEDLHCADDATLNLVRFLGRRVHDAPLLLVVTARDDTSDGRARLRRALVNLPVEACARVEVPRLTMAAVHALASERSRDGARIFELTGGNPFLITEILRSGEECPATIQDLVLFRVERLSPGARRLLDVAAIFPKRVEDWLLDAVCKDRDANDLDDCLAAGLLKIEAGSYVFRHEVARRVIEDAIDASKKVELNRRALSALQARLAMTTTRHTHHASLEAKTQKSANVAGLTPRQIEVLALINRGLCNAEIASQLRISTRTVDQHVSALLEKIEAIAQGERAAHARRIGLVKPTE